MKMFIAGLESVISYSDIKNFLKDHKNNFFMLSSFYYCKDNTAYQEIIKDWNKENFLLDSGAYTFRKTEKKNLDEYVDKYIDFINKYDIKYFFEMDIDFNKNDLPLVKKYREKIEKETGKKCIPVYHSCRGFDEWKKMCEEYDYVAIGGISAKNPVDYIKRLVKYANKKNVKVHGLGWTKKGFENLGFYSVDSTSWNGLKYGFIWYVKNGELKKYISSKNERLKKEKVIDISLQNLKSWYYYQKKMKGMGFWKI